MNRDIFQLSLYGTTFVGQLDGVLELSQLRMYGNFGIGAIEGLEGEITLSEGKFFHASVDGDVSHPPTSMKSPKMTVTHYTADNVFKLDGAFHLSALKTKVMEQLPSLNYIYAIKIIANYQWVKLMSYPQQKKPYPPISLIAENKIINTLHNIQGYMIGFYTPPWLEDLCGPGWHFHFLDEANHHGGHVIDCSLSKAVVECQYKNSLNIQLPNNEEFHKCYLGGVKEQLKKIIDSLN